MNLRITTILASSGLLVLGACADPSATGGANTDMSRTTQGAIAGSVAGAVLGAATAGSDRGQSAARGAVLGGVAGAVAGNMMDRQAQALQQSISNPNIQIVNHGDHLQVIMPEGILFATSSAAVSGAAQNDLYAVARNLNQYPNTVVEVVGHTDNTGSAALNRDLSQRRAQSVAGILSAAGVASNRIATTGRGFDQPIASNATAEGRAQNRRVEILIRPTR
ncbi:Outer membrane protein OmpA [Paracoccus alcaliphilus]|uniref:Outer membrane protein OmpA n=1 Tax=Paracoccus alcaliphilus TaxID=34002 RepID=A0A1H8GCJ0_9RHOB|nr:OmpA family protein [Paracoccus alcaliphilus]WCR17941.1 OmpA family protein [Paracoccus alcaliphilus]SEN41464.1 Outer membrane protein OmpA [Paracoccus alcaliphilus]